MNKVSNLTLKQFTDWFNENFDPNVGLVELSIQRLAAWAAWQEAYDQGYDAGTKDEKEWPSRSVEAQRAD